MDGLPAWLPPMVNVNPWTPETYEILYGIFERDFKERTPILYLGSRVRYFPHKCDGKEDIFWHMTSCKDENTGERLPDPRRCERLPWARPAIDNADQPEVLTWDCRERKDVRTYVWLEKEDYVIVMVKKADGTRFLLTAFHIDRPHTRRNLERKYKRRMG